MRNPKIVVVAAGLSEPSSTALLGERLAEAARSALERAGVEASIETVNLRSLAHGIADYMTMGFPSGPIGAALDAVRSADAVIAVTPTFKAGYTGLFKSFWDLTDDADLTGKPVILAATGGTARHSLMIDAAMRPLFAYLHADVVPTGVFAATDDFGADTSLQSRIDRAGEELAERLVWRFGTGEAIRGVTTVREAAEESVPSGSEAAASSGRGAEARQPVLPGGSGLPPLTVTPFEELLGR
ncbi:CE1759 family FMN reductase [Curtobacterium sp. S6]|uniref:CE1759 family FMN reductase n=1 Tax=Curtobacterium sp. S6 TaxID=1479623 RepID=UPI0009EC194E|nr:CE1759 family FMN reductase [Curtobacterium sp. S6]